MGNPTGFLEIDKKERNYEDPKDRLKHFKEFIVPLTNEEVSKQGSRCMDCGIPYCHQGCPVNNLCLLYTSPSPRDKRQSRMPSSA